jgi:hypothetical protein
LVLERIERKEQQGPCHAPDKECGGEARWQVVPDEAACLARQIASPPANRVSEGKTSECTDTLPDREFSASRACSLKMTSTLLGATSLIDSTGLAILATTVTTLVLGIAANLWLRARYAALEKDLRRAHDREATFSHPVLRHVVREASEAAQRSREINTQAIIEDCFQSDLRPMLLAERFVRAATGLVIILGLLGTFYGLTLSIGKIVHLVAAQTVVASDVAQGVGEGLTHALAGMAVAFSNSLVGILSAVILTVLGVVSNVSDRRTAVMVQIETALDRARAERPSAGDAPTFAGFGDSIARLDGAVVRFESALQSFATTTRDFHEFNAHLKDNVQRLSLTFADLSDSLKTQLGTLVPGRKV